MTQISRGSRRWIGLALIAILFFSLSSLRLIARVQGQAPATQGPPLHGGEDQHGTTEEAWEIQQRKAAEKKYNAQRQQDIQKDAEKLLQLATELKQSVDKTNKDTLSLDVIKKAEQIEKLAKSVKDKMKGP
jgi:nitric oxide reductase activation protein